MPNWQPNWDDVRWNWGASSEASRSLRQSANQLEDMTATRSRLAAEAQAEWRGVFRQQFDVEFDTLVGKARNLAAEMRRKANEIDRQAERARAEQQHRERERERWRRERDEERRRKKKS